MVATRAASRSLSPKRISAVATLSFSFNTGTAFMASNRAMVARGIEIAAALLGVGEGDEDLARRQADGAQRLGPGASERDLADGRGGLAVLELECAARQRKRSTRRPNAIAPEDTTMISGATPLQRGEIGGERVEPRPADAVRVDEQRGADLDDDAAEVGETGQDEVGHAALYRKATA